MERPKPGLARFAPWLAVFAVGAIVGVGAAIFAFGQKATGANPTTVDAKTAFPVDTAQTPPSATVSSTTPSSAPKAGWQSAQNTTSQNANVGELPRHPIAAGFKPDDKKPEDCNGQFLCLEQAYGNLVYNEGPKEALAAFDKAIATPGPTEQNCHRIAHTMGAAGLERFKGNVGKAFAAGSSSCWSGYYHGILEHAFQTEKLADLSAKELGRVSRRLCADPDVRSTSWIAYQCVHGLGHGLMITTELDLPLAIDACNTLETNWDQQSCKGGVFMENINTSYGTASKYLKKDDLLYPCNMVKEGDKLYCYLMVTSRILRENGWNWDATAALCTKSDQGWVATCFQSYGRDASGSSRQNADEIQRLCGIASPHGGQYDCIVGAAKDMTANYTDGTLAGRMCDKSPEGMRAGCYWAVGSISGGFTATAEARLSDCQKYSADAAMVEACRKGANGEQL